MLLGFGALGGCRLVIGSCGGCMVGFGVRIAVFRACV